MRSLKCVECVDIKIWWSGKLPVEEVTFEQRPEGDEGESNEDTSGKAFTGRGTIHEMFLNMARAS